MESTRIKDVIAFIAIFATGLVLLGLSIGDEPKWQWIKDLLPVTTLLIGMGGGYFLTVEHDERRRKQDRDALNRSLAYEIADIMDYALATSEAMRATRSNLDTALHLEARATLSLIPSMRVPDQVRGKLGNLDPTEYRPVRAFEDGAQLFKEFATVVNSNSTSGAPLIETRILGRILHLLVVILAAGCDALRALHISAKDAGSKVDHVAEMASACKILAELGIDPTKPPAII